MVKETTALMVIIVVAVLVVGGVAYSLAPKILDSISEFLETGFLPSDANGLTTIGLKIQYADGSEKEFVADEMALLPLTIIDDGGEVMMIIPYVRTTVEHTFDGVKSWEYEVTDFDALMVKVDTGESEYFLENEQRLREQASNWVSGQHEDIGLGSWSDGELEDWLDNYPEKFGSGGNFELRLTADVRVKLYAINGDISEETGSSSATWTFEWSDEGITSLTVIVANDVTHYL